MEYEKTEKEMDRELAFLAFILVLLIYGLYVIPTLIELLFKI